VEVWVPQIRAHLHELVERLAGVSFQTMLAVHALLVLSACALAFSRKLWQTILAWIAVVGFGLIWFGVNIHWEGRVLYRFAPGHGLTQADLVVPVVIAIALLIRGLRYLGRAWLVRREQRRRAGVPTVFRVMWPKV
jgi:hypothetical protein